MFNSSQTDTSWVIAYFDVMRRPGWIFFKNKIEIKINRFSLFHAQLVVFHAFKMTLKTMIIFGNALFWLNGTTVREIIRSGNARSYCSRSKQKKKQRLSVYSRGYFKLTRIITFSKNIIPHELLF